MHTLCQRLLCFLLRKKTLKYLDWLNDNLSLSPQAMIELQNDLIQTLITHAYDHTQYYRTLMDSLNIKPADIKSKEDLRQLPILTKSLIRQNLDQLKSNDAHSKTLTEFTSSGSTGNQVVIYKSAFFDQMSNALVLRSLSLVGWERSYKSYWFWNVIYLHEKLRKNPIFKIILRLINRTIIVDAVNTTPRDYEKFARQIRRYRPRVLFGNAVVFHNKLKSFG